MPLNIQSENSNALLTKCGIFFKIFQAVSRIAKNEVLHTLPLESQNICLLKVVENRADRNSSACSCKS